MSRLTPPTPLDQTGRSIGPSTVFVLVVAIVFVTEGLIMLALPAFRRSLDNVWLEGLADAAVLVIVISPAVWLLLVRPLRQTLAERGQLLDRLFDIQESERAAIARELHDELGQQLTAIQLRLRALSQSLNDADVQRQVDGIRDLSLAAHQNIRQVSRRLRPGTLDQFGLTTAIERLVSDFTTAGGPDIQFQHDLPEDRRLAVEIENALYRVCQEAVTNAIQHGQSRKIAIHLRQDARGVVFRVVDDGEGFDVSTVGKQSGVQQLFGLLSMRERIRVLGGEFSLQSQLGTGTTVVARLPARLAKG